MKLILDFDSNEVCIENETEKKVISVKDLEIRKSKVLEAIGISDITGIKNIKFPGEDFVNVREEIDSVYVDEQLQEMADVLKEFYNGNL